MFLLIRGLFLLSLTHLIDLLFGRVLASICEAQLRICVKSVHLFGGTFDIITICSMEISKHLFKALFVASVCDLSVRGCVISVWDS